MIELLGKYGLVPVVVLDRAEDALPLGEALEEGGLPIMEITLRTEAGLESIRRVRQAKPDYLLGAGTVITLDQCKASVDAGASYIVSPGFNKEIVEWCLANNVDVLPGCVTPTEITMALSYGLKVLKFFPANIYGGASGLKALYAPFQSTGVKFVPTGGVSLQNLGEYADKPFLHAIGGSWLTPKDLIQAGDFTAITKITKDSILKLLGFELGHLGINTDSPEAAHEVGEIFENAFGWGQRFLDVSVFAGNEIEAMNYQGAGRMGHIAVRTNSVDRAVFHLEKKGFKADPSTFKYKGGRLVFAYLTQDFGGFALHLSQK